MTNDDLERELRAEAGPREQGYVPAHLPTPIDKATNRRPLPLLRATFLVPAIAAGVIAVAVVGAVLRDDGRTNVGASGEPSPSASPSAPETADCQVDDLSLTAERWGGAAGSCGTVITVTLARGQGPCTVSVNSGARITDTAGAIVIETAVGLRNIPASILLQPDTSYSIGVSWSNWCESPPSEPIGLSIRPPSIDSWIAVPVPVGGADPVPPCMGSHDTALNLTELQPDH